LTKKTDFQTILFMQQWLWCVALVTRASRRRWNNW